MVHHGRGQYANNTKGQGMANTTIKRAIMEAGGLFVVAEALRVDQSTVHDWPSKNYVPKEHIKALCDMCSIEPEAILESMKTEYAQQVDMEYREWI